MKASTLLLTALPFFAADASADLFAVSLSTTTTTSTTTTVITSITKPSCNDTVQCSPPNIKLLLLPELSNPPDVGNAAGSLTTPNLHCFAAMPVAAWAVYNGQNLGSVAVAAAFMLAAAAPAQAFEASSESLNVTKPLCNGTVQCPPPNDKLIPPHVGNAADSITIPSLHRLAALPVAAWAVYSSRNLGSVAVAVAWVLAAAAPAQAMEASNTTAGLSTKTTEQKAACSTFRGTIECGSQTESSALTLPVPRVDQVLALSALAWAVYQGRPHGTIAIAAAWIITAAHFACALELASAAPNATFNIPTTTVPNRDACYTVNNGLLDCPLGYSIPASSSAAIGSEPINFGTGSLRNLFKRCVKCPADSAPCPLCASGELCAMAAGSCEKCEYRECIRAPNPKPPSSTAVAAAAAATSSSAALSVSLDFEDYMIWQFGLGVLLAAVGFVICL